MVVKGIIIVIAIIIDEQGCPHLAGSFTHSPGEARYIGPD